jgi:hypothetical protein
VFRPWTMRSTRNPRWIAYSEPGAVPVAVRPVAVPQVLVDRPPDVPHAQVRKRRQVRRLQPVRVDPDVRPRGSFRELAQPARIEEAGEDADPLIVNSTIRRGPEQLKIELIIALSPEAKGRVERLFGTLQDR